MFSKNNDSAPRGQAKSSAPETDHGGVVQLARRSYLLPRREIGVLRFLLEGYDGLGFARTLDAAQGLVEIAWPAERSAEMEGVLEALCRELGMTVATPRAPGS